MPRTIKAIYENGVFRPLAQIKGFKKHQKITITVKNTMKKKHQLEGLCGILPDEDAAEMLKIIKDEFEKVNIDEW